MYLRYFTGLFTIVASLLLGGCKKLVTVDPPITQLVSASVFNGDNTAIAAQLAVYAQMQSVPWFINLITGLSSDELRNWSTYQTNMDLYANALNAETDGGNLIWQMAYNYIYQENAILENVSASPALSNAVRKQLVGEADFMRAYWYYYLVSLYGDVPLVTTTSYEVNSVMSRTASAKVCQQIIQDLSNAEDSLSNMYLDATDTVTTIDRVRPTSWAAAALLARVYLSIGQYANAESKATSVINNTSLYSLPAIDSAFFMNSSEAIWQILPPSTYLYTYDGQYLILTSPPTSSSSASPCCTISPQLMNTFETGDLRQTEWIGSYFDGTTTWYFPYKYKDNSINQTSVLREYTMVLRLGEQILIRAEARAQQNNINGAIVDINTIRARAALAGLANTLSQTQVLSAIAHERQVELFDEGQRWLDLKRTGNVDAVMTVETPQKGGVWQSYQQWYPLSITDLNNGINLVQNAGY